ncbi:hypothetical protein H4219_004387 [Mycoemilia scoparia]|uniref:LITAF domain-containing protein n=1 Tax=Mycoemilia scoparia TaxID=417184 RepID=A0A9W7ZSQ3_9FUNG|nr:hypothetical protein H4219_004387 [Mycoemilia scoparia]
MPKKYDLVEANETNTDFSSRRRSGETFRNRIPSLSDSRDYTSNMGNNYYPPGVYNDSGFNSSLSNLSASGAAKSNLMTTNSAIGGVGVGGAPAMVNTNAGFWSGGGAAVQPGSFQNRVPNYMDDDIAENVGFGTSNNILGGDVDTSVYQTNNFSNFGSYNYRENKGDFGFESLSISGGGGGVSPYHPAYPVSPNSLVADMAMTTPISMPPTISYSKPDISSSAGITDFYNSTQYQQQQHPQQRPNQINKSCQYTSKQHNPGLLAPKDERRISLSSSNNIDYYREYTPPSKNTYSTTSGGIKSNTIEAGTKSLAKSRSHSYNQKGSADPNSWITTGKWEPTEHDDAQTNLTMHNLLTDEPMDTTYAKFNAANRRVGSNRLYEPGSTAAASTSYLNKSSSHNKKSHSTNLGITSSSPSSSSAAKKSHQKRNSTYKANDDLLELNDYEVNNYHQDELITTETANSSLALINTTTTNSYGQKQQQKMLAKSKVGGPNTTRTSSYNMAGASTTTVDDGTAMQDPNLGWNSQYMECPWCHANVKTEIKRKIRFKSGGSATLVGLVAWPLFWVPLIVPQLKRHEHYCPACHRCIGIGRHKNS